VGKSVFLGRLENMKNDKSNYCKLGELMEDLILIENQELFEIDSPDFDGDDD
jgi:hypothetical protein